MEWLSGGQCPLVIQNEQLLFKTFSCDIFPDK